MLLPGKTSFFLIFLSAEKTGKRVTKRSERAEENKEVLHNWYPKPTKEEYTTLPESVNQKKDFSHLKKEILEKPASSEKTIFSVPYARKDF